MRLAIDAITQAEGAAPPIVSTPASPAPAPNHSQKPATMPAALPATQQPTPPEQPVNVPAPENVTPMPDGQTHDGQNGQDVNISAAPPAEKNRNTAKAEAKLETSLAYLATLNTTATAKPDKWVVNASILASLTGCYRPAINTFIQARKQRIDELNAAHGLGPGHDHRPDLLAGLCAETADGGPVCTFLRWQRRFPIPSSATFGKIGNAYVEAIYAYAKAHNIAVVRFEKGQEGENGASVSGGRRSRSDATLWPLPGDSLTAPSPTLQTANFSRLETLTDS